MTNAKPWWLQTEKGKGRTHVVGLRSPRTTCVSLLVFLSPSSFFPSLPKKKKKTLNPNPDLEKESRGYDIYISYFNACYGHCLPAAVADWRCCCWWIARCLHQCLILLFELFSLHSAGIFNAMQYLQ